MAVTGADGMGGEGGSVAEGLAALHALCPVGLAVAGRCRGFACRPGPRDGAHGRRAAHGWRLSQLRHVA